VGISIVYSCLEDEYIEVERATVTDALGYIFK
jgi:hypothetical protein